MAEVYCGSEPCPLFLNSTCVFYTGESLLYIGVQTNDTLEAIIVKINQAFQNTGIGYAFTNGVIQPTPSQPVQLGGALIQNTTIGGNFTLTFSGNVQAAKHITTGGSSSQFVKGDGTLDSTSYQPAANYITGLSGDVLASGPGVAAATLATVNFSSGTFGNGNTIPIVTVNSKGLVTNITPTPINLPPISLTFIGDVVGSGLTGSNITLLLQNVNPNPYNTITPLKFSVNGKGLVTSASPITASDIVNILGYYPGSAGTSGTSGTSGIDGTFLGSSGTSGTSGSSATSGTSGTSGSSGTSGTSGSTGTSGSSGTTGTSGSSGTTGTSGSSGTSGTTGTSGSSGTSGTTGTSGSSGLSGDRFKTTSTTTYTLQAPGNPGTLTVDPGLAYTVAQSIIIAFDANNHNEAEVTSYNSITGVINFVTFTLTGSGTYSSWFINIDGASGGDGTSGTSGTTGTSGSSGTSGTTGTSGSSGTSGTTGTSGSSGTSGTSATNGTGGTSGTSGSSGTSGTTGTSGTSATSGTSGTSGVTGLTALNGLTAQVQNFATGTSGTDFAISSSVSTHTFNLPNASATARGVVTTGTQTFAGYKIFTGTISANNDIQLAAAGTASTTFIKNISGAGLTSVGSNGFGFNNSDNIYFSGSNKGGGIIAFSNTGNRTYTLQDASGTLAFTSDISNSLTGYVTLATTQTITGAKTFDTTTSDFLILNSTNANGGVLSFRRNGTNVGHIGNSAQLGGGVLDAIEVRSGIGSSVILKTDGGALTLATGGGVTLTGALNGTSASFSSTLAVTGQAAFGTTVNTTHDVLIQGTTSNNTKNAFRIQNSSAASLFAVRNDGVIDLYNNTTVGGTLSVTGAATFSSSVTANYGGTFVIPVESPGSGSVALTARTSNGANDVFRWFDGATQLGVFKNSGNVGIGTVSPSEKLSIFTSASAEVMMTLKNGSQNLSFGVNNAAGSFIYESSNAALRFGTNDTERMRITSGGNIIVGYNQNTNNTIGRTFATSHASANRGATLFYGINDGSNGGMFIYNVAAPVGALNSQYVTFETHEGGVRGGEVMRLTSLGFLKASNTGLYVFPTGNYHELRTDQVHQWSTIMSNSSSSPYVLNLRHSNVSPNNADNWFIFCEDSSAARFRVASNGNVTNTNGSYGSISDAKLKENIEDATPKLDDLMKVKVRNYNLIGDDKKQIGVIAQELEEIFPAMIDESPDYEYVEVPQVDEEGNEILNEEGVVVTEKQRVSKGTSTKSVKYSVFVPMLIKAIQELKTEINSLKNQIK